MAEESNIHPLNTEWNRKANLLESTGKASFIGARNGTAYFSWTDLEGGTVYLRCEENFFYKNFKVNKSSNQASADSADALQQLLAKKTVFKIYPFDLVKP